MLNQTQQDWILKTFFTLQCHKPCLTRNEKRERLRTRRESEQSAYCLPCELCCYFLESVLFVPLVFLLQARSPEGRHVEGIFAGILIKSPVAQTVTYMKSVGLDSFGELC